MKIALLTTDNREDYNVYAQTSPWFGTAPEALLQGFARLPGLEIHVLSCTQQPVESPAKLAENVWFHSLHVPKIGWMRTFYQGCIRAVRKKLREIQPDIVHGQGTERDCAISAVLSGFPNVLTVHGNMNTIARLRRARWGSFHWLAARLENFTLPRTAGIICISEYAQTLVARHTVRTWIVPNAIRRDFFDLPRVAAAVTERPLLINVGTISAIKRQQQLVTVLDSLRGQGLSFDTVFVGAADAPPEYTQKFAALLAAANRRHGGFEHIPHLDVASLCRLMDRAAALIHFSSEETFGLIFAEAIARGMYLFGSDVGAARTIAQGVADVQLFGVDDWVKMQAAVQDWLQSGQHKKPRPPSPPASFVQTFHPVSVALRHLEIYQAVLNTVS
jgi:glycosyltransferase involved in cell wall biosynthesis